MCATLVGPVDAAAALHILRHGSNFLGDEVQYRKYLNGPQISNFPRHMARVFKVLATLPFPHPNIRLSECIVGAPNAHALIDTFPVDVRGPGEYHNPKYGRKVLKFQLVTTVRGQPIYHPSYQISSELSEAEGGEETERGNAAKNEQEAVASYLSSHTIRLHGKASTKRKTGSPAHKTFVLKYELECPVSKLERSFCTCRKCVTLVKKRNARNAAKKARDERRAARQERKSSATKRKCKKQPAQPEVSEDRPRKHRALWKLAAQSLRSTLTEAQWELMFNTVGVTSKFIANSILNCRASTVLMRLICTPNILRSFSLQQFFAKIR